MTTFLVIFHFVVCLLLIGLILLQSGKGADMGAAFGGASQTVFGSRGPATFLNKFTAIVAVLFLTISIWLAQIARNVSVESVVDTLPAAEEMAPAVDATTDGAAPEATLPSEEAK